MLVPRHTDYCSARGCIFLRGCATVWPCCPRSGHRQCAEAGTHRADGV